MILNNRRINNEMSYALSINSVCFLFELILVNDVKRIMHIIGKLILLNDINRIMNVIVMCRIN